MQFFHKIFRAGRLLMLLAAFLCFGAAAAPLAAQPVDRLRGDFQRLKERFEEQLSATADPRAASALSAESSALAWRLAAVGLNADSAASQTLLDSAAEFENSRAAIKNWDERHLAALDFYYQSVAELIPPLSNATEQPFMVSELEEVAEKTEEQFAALEGKPDAAPERRVIVSGALVSLMSVMVRAVGGGAMEQPTQAIMANVVTKADYISKRPDIHYRAKLSFLYANNVEGLCALIFLLGQNAGPPLSAELAVIHGTLNQYGADLSLPDSQSLTWAAQTQAALPLAFWLAANYYRPAPQPNQGTP